MEENFMAAILFLLSVLVFLLAFSALWIYFGEATLKILVRMGGVSPKLLQAKGLTPGEHLLRFLIVFSGFLGFFNVSLAQYFDRLVNRRL